MSVVSKVRLGLDVLCQASGDPRVCGIDLALRAILPDEPPEELPFHPGTPRGVPAGEPSEGLDIKAWMEKPKGRGKGRGISVVSQAEAIAATYLKDLVPDQPAGVPRMVRTISSNEPPIISQIEKALGGGIGAAVVTEGIARHFQRGGGGGRYFQPWNPRRQTILKKQSGRSGPSTAWGAVDTYGT